MYSAFLIRVFRRLRKKHLNRNLDIRARAWCTTNSSDNISLEELANRNPCYPGE
jgi:hypothetical protein